MECHFINLDKEVERRAFVERNFSDVMTDGWRLTRFPAVYSDEIDRLDVQGNATSTEKACFFSHRNLLKSRLDNFEHILVVEDDVLFHKETFAIVDRVIPTLARDGWDLVFLDVCIPDAKVMIDLFRGERARPDNGHFALIDLRTMMFCGATSYIVNGRSKHKLSRLLDSQRRIDVPYDLFLRDMIQSSQLISSVIFPFISTLSEFADSSTVKQTTEGLPDRTWNQFRRFMWIGRNPPSQRQVVTGEFAVLCDEELQTFAMILGSAVAADFR